MSRLRFGPWPASSGRSSGTRAELGLPVLCSVASAGESLPTLSGDGYASLGRCRYRGSAGVRVRWLMNCVGCGPEEKTTSKVEFADAGRL
jgi:hypothetical protein